MAQQEELQLHTAEVPGSDLGPDREWGSNGFHERATRLDMGIANCKFLGNAFRRAQMDPQWPNNKMNKHFP